MYVGHLSNQLDMMQVHTFLPFLCRFMCVPQSSTHPLLLQVDFDGRFSIEGAKQASIVCMDYMSPVIRKCHKFNRLLAPSTGTMSTLSSVFVARLHFVCPCNHRSHLKSGV